MITSLCLINVFFVYYQFSLYFPLFPWSTNTSGWKNAHENHEAENSTTTALTETHDMVVWANLFRSDLTGVMILPPQ